MARNFNGTTDLISMGDVLDFTLASFTFMAWINPRSFGELSGGRIIDKAGTGTVGFYFKVENVDVVGGLVLHVLALDALSTASIITLNKWQHVAVSYDGVNARFYVDGAAQGAPAFAQVPVGNAENLVIGNRTDQTRTFDGWIADVRVYNVILTATEIADARTGGNPQSGGLIGRWKLCGAASPEPDSSGGGNNGTLTGTSPVNNPSEIFRVCRSEQQHGVRPKAFAPGRAL